MFSAVLSFHHAPAAGSIPQGLSTEEFFKGYSAPRNKEIMRIFKDVELVEYLGSGIPRILKEYPPEVFNITDHFIRVSFSFYQETSGKASGKTSEMILEQIRKNQSVTIPELAEFIGITERSIERNIHKLQKTGIIIRKGGRKIGYWQITG